VKAGRRATFDNEGTLRPEQPTYFQFAFMLDRIKTLAGNEMIESCWAVFPGVVVTTSRIRVLREGRRQSPKRNNAGVKLTAL
jgi:hypothetical protein